MRLTGTSLLELGAKIEEVEEMVKRSPELWKGLRIEARVIAPETAVAETPTTPTSGNT